MNSHISRRFRTLLAALPPHIQRQARFAFRQFLRDPRHPSLHFKQVHQNPSIWSVRVGISYRALAAMDGPDPTWFWIGTHAEYDRIISQL